MLKSILISLIGLSAIISPIETVYAATSTTDSTNASITINPGDTGFTQLISSNLLFQPYTIGPSHPSQTNISTLTFKVADFSGSNNGWNVTTTFSDFTLDANNDGTPEDRLSNHNATIDLKCGTTSFKTLIHSCQSDINRAFTTSGTAPSTIVSAPSNSTSTGEFEYTIPTNFFVLKFNNNLKEGTYNGSVTIDFASVYRP